MTVKLLEQKFYAIAVLMGWIKNDQAAQEVMKVEKAVGAPVENMRVSFSSGGDGIAGNDKHSGIQHGKPSNEKP
jgi:hypothetical protein